MPAINPPANVIWLKVIAGHWHAEIAMDDLMLDMFGTNVLPTPFTAATPAERVWAHIQRNNPDMTVWVIA